MGAVKGNKFFNCLIYHYWILTAWYEGGMLLLGFYILYV